MKILSTIDQLRNQYKNDKVHAVTDSAKAHFEGAITALTTLRNLIVRQDLEEQEKRVPDSHSDLEGEILRRMDHEKDFVDKLHKRGIDAYTHMAVYVELSELLEIVRIERG